MYESGTVVGGRYRLVKKIGEGGMATIWEAEHQTLGSPVAVKFLQWQGPQSEQIRERFLREARVAASVRHRNVVEITDFGLTDDKTPYIVMEMLRGESLADRLDRETRLEPIEAARLVSLTLRGIAVVHEKGIVHRDLKPENIFIVDDPDGTYPKLLDFGVSKRADPTAKNLTQEGMIVGTPEYMSPEQARGLRDVDSRTDVYSMGVILYEMLTGRLPYESENIGDLIVMITTQPPTPVIKYKADLSPELVAIVERALQKDRNLRFQTAREMRWALIEAFRGEQFGDVDSGVTGISELPPPPAGWAGTGSYQVVDGEIKDMIAQARQNAQQGLELEETPAEPASSDRRAPPSQPRMALGAPPTPAMGLPAQIPSERPKPARGRTIAITTGAFIVLGVGAFVLYQQLGRAEAEEEPVAVATPWEPASEMTLLDVDGGPFVDAGETVRVVLYRVPDGGTPRIAEVPVEGSRADVPVAPGAYPVEVFGSDGTMLWRVEHPADVDGEYEVWPMSADELPDAGIAAGEEAVEPAAPTKRRRPRRGNRRRRSGR